MVRICASYAPSFTGCIWFQPKKREEYSQQELFWTLGCMTDRRKHCRSWKRDRVPDRGKNFSRIFRQFVALLNSTKASGLVQLWCSCWWYPSLQMLQNERHAWKLRSRCIKWAASGATITSIFVEFSCNSSLWWCPPSRMLAAGSSLHRGTKALLVSKATACVQVQQSSRDRRGSAP